MEKPVMFGFSSPSWGRAERSILCAVKQRLTMQEREDVGQLEGSVPCGIHGGGWLTIPRRRLLQKGSSLTELPSITTVRSMSLELRSQLPRLLSHSYAGGANRRARGGWLVCAPSTCSSCAVCDPSDGRSSLDQARRNSNLSRRRPPNHLLDYFPENPRRTTSNSSSHVQQTTTLSKTESRPFGYRDLTSQ